MSAAWQLVGHPDGDICDLALLSVQKALKKVQQIARVDSVANIAAAQSSLAANGRDQIDLLVIAATMPADDSASGGASNRDATRDFIKQIKRELPQLPLIVLSSTPDEALASFLSAFDHTGLVALGNDFGTNLVARVQALRASAGAAPAERARAPAVPDPWIELDIHLGGNQLGTWRMNRVGTDGFEFTRPFQFDRRQIDLFIRHSKRLDDDVAKNDPQWRIDFNELSRELRELLFRYSDDNQDFWQRFLKHRERVGGVAQSRVRVTVDEQTHSMLLEALRDSEDDDDEFWVLQAPVFRRYAQDLCLPPLFNERDAASREQPIDCLVIEADPQPGFVTSPSGQTERFDRLKYLSGEAERVEAILKKHAGGRVERPSLGTVEGDLRSHVVDKLREGPWHLVHFCGHVSGNADAAGLVLRAGADGVLPVRTLAAAQTRTRLLFLSSCRSASTRMVLHAVEKHVGAVIGFQWVIDDRAASDFAIEFYEQLFDTQSAHCRNLEHAMLAARRAAYRREPEQPSWVAPVLVMQLG